MRLPCMASVYRVYPPRQGAEIIQRSWYKWEKIMKFVKEWWCDSRREYRMIEIHWGHTTNDK